MIKFFRPIRKALLMENKTSKYFKYAIGEIILVVIGILIALQINTWNESRKATNEENKILTALQSDFIVSKERIEETMVMQNRVMDYSRILVDIHERQDQKDFEYFDKHYRPAFTYKALNRLIQGSAADMTKKAMVKLYEAGIIPHIQIHDELCFSIQNEDQAVKIKNIMETAIELKVPNKVDYESGPNWGTIK